MILSNRDRLEQIEMLESALEMHPDSPSAPKVRALLAELQRSTGVTDTSPRPDDGVGRRAGSPAANQYGTFTVHAASERQVAFLARLIAEKNTDGVKIPASLEGISKKSASALIDKLIDRPAKPGTGPVVSPKQIDLINKLLGEKDITAGVFNLNGQEIETMAQWQALIPTLTGGRNGTASKAIDALFTFPRKPVERKPEVELAPGAYRIAGDRIVRVYLGQQSGKMLAAELVDITAEDRDDAWRYLGLASRFVTSNDHRLTVDEAEALAASGADHSWCCVCSRRLDDPNSVSRGIGPICRAKQGGI